LPPDPPERRYALREVKARLHQTSFRDAVLAAYGGRSAISYLPESRLLDAAHIVMDADEQLGQPIVSNGLPLTKIHHAAHPPATPRRENKKALIQNEINGLPINSFERY
jgi:putative restriction endonuclease